MGEEDVQSRVQGLRYVCWSSMDFSVILDNSTIFLDKEKTLYETEAAVHL